MNTATAKFSYDFYLGLGRSAEWFQYANAYVQFRDLVGCRWIPAPDFRDGRRVGPRHSADKDRVGPLEHLAGSLPGHAHAAGSNWCEKSRHKREPGRAKHPIVHT